MERLVSVCFEKQCEARNSIAMEQSSGHLQLHGGGEENSQLGCGLQPLCRRRYFKYCIEDALARWKSIVCPPRRLENRIRELCAKAITSDKTELPSAISDLGSVLHEHKNANTG
jgi:hypothetical protein